jgi:2-polyprenyl-6-methoxyphenol hydroxylase-like FAD-dependent oxidoreductase
MIMRLAVAGAGIAGMAAALGLARAGHEVTLVERDAGGPLDDPRAAFGWARPGAPQYHHPHVLLARACLEMLRHIPDVYAHLLDLGATVIEASHPQAEPDPDLRTLGVRRPLLEYALRRAIAEQDRITTRYGLTVRGVGAGSLGTDDGEIAADLVVDALGRTSPLRQGGGVPCGLAYYSRYYRLRDDNPMRPSHLVVPARVDYGYAGANMFWAEDRHVGLVVYVASGDRDLRALRASAAYDALVAATPSLVERIGPDVAEPVTDVYAMGGLQASWREPDPTGRVVSIGDSWCHTNPVYGWGASLGLAQAFSLPGLLAEHGLDGVTKAFVALHTATAYERYATSLGLDRGLTRLLAGEKVDVFNQAAEPDMFRTRALGLAGTVDPQVYQRQTRWVCLLDPAATVDGDATLLERGFAAARTALANLPAPPRLPTRAELLGRIS